MTASASQQRPGRIRVFLACRDRTLGTLAAVVAASAMWPTTAAACAVSAGLIGVGWFLWTQSPSRRVLSELESRLPLLERKRACSRGSAVRAWRPRSL